MGRGARGLQWLAVPICLWVVFPWLRAPAQTVYTWTDEKGTVHFSDQRPAGAKNVAERRMPAEKESEPVDATEAPTLPERERAAATRAGAPQVVLERQDIERTGASSFRVAGTVRNTGGTAAPGVRISLAAPDPVQGNPCLEDEIAIEPDPLPPGESVSFEKVVDHPCLHGDARIELAVRWQEP